MKNAFKMTLSALALVAMTAVSASAATLSGVFNVKVVNQTNLNSAQSQATISNFNTYYNAGADGVNRDMFTYTGDLFFGPGAATIATWLATGTPGGVNGLDATVGGKQLSKGNINTGTATTSFFLFEYVGNLIAGDFTIGHDDGVAVLDDDNLLGGFVGPNSFRVTGVPDFTGGKFELLYVATNNNPSRLEVDFAPIPLPAGGVLLLTALAGVAALRRRKAA